MFDNMLSQLETDLRTALGTCVTGLVVTARPRLESEQVALSEERARGLTEAAEERAKALAEVDARRAELRREIVAMQTHKETQEGRVVLNICGYRFGTSVQTLRRVPHTFFDAYFSGRYAQDVCNDGSIFVDRYGEHFGHVLEYMRDGAISVAEADARPSVSLLRALKREFGFYCIELYSETLAEPEHLEVALVIGGALLVGIGDVVLKSMEKFDVSSGQWSTAAAMGTARYAFSACVVEGGLIVSGGYNRGWRTSCVERYSLSSDSWKYMASLPNARSNLVTVAVGSAVYAIGGFKNDEEDAASTVFRFDSRLDTWSEVAPMPEGQVDCAACAIGSDIFVFGGNDTDDDVVTDSVFKYDTEANTWTTLAPMPSPKYILSANVLNGLIYIICNDNSSHEVQQFEPASGAWSTLTTRASWEFYSVNSFVLGGNLYLAGGAYNCKGVERYDVATNSWSAVENMLGGRTSFGAVTSGPSGPSEEQDLFDCLIAKAVHRDL
jgi:hypothetical protein